MTKYFPHVWSKFVCFLFYACFLYRASELLEITILIILTFKEESFFLNVILLTKFRLGALNGPL